MKSKVEIKEEFIKLDSLLKFAGVAQTGGYAKILINQGEILVDGEICYARGKKIYPNMIVSYKKEEFEVVSVAG